MLHVINSGRTSDKTIDYVEGSLLDRHFHGVQNKIAVKVDEFGAKAGLKGYQINAEVESSAKVATAKALKSLESQARKPWVDHGLRVQRSHSKGDEADSPTDRGADSLTTSVKQQLRRARSRRRVRELARPAKHVQQPRKGGGVHGEGSGQDHDEHSTFSLALASNSKHGRHESTRTRGAGHSWSIEAASSRHPNSGRRADRDLHRTVRDHEDRGPLSEMERGGEGDSEAAWVAAHTVATRPVGQTMPAYLSKPNQAWMDVTGAWGAGA